MSSKITRRELLIGLGLGVAGIAAASGLYAARGDIAQLLGSSKPAAAQSGLEDAVIKHKQQVLEITRDNYRDILGLDIKDDKELDSRPPVFVKFYTDTCPPCREIDPAYKEVAGMYDPDKEVRFAQYKCTFNTPGKKRFNPELPPEIPIVEDWEVYGVPEIVLVHKGKRVVLIHEDGRERNIEGRFMLPLWDGPEQFKALVEDILRQYCADCGYLNRK